MKHFVMRPIGHVCGQNIELHRRWMKALDGIEVFSHVVVLFWLEKARKPDMKIHPKGIQQIPKIGYQHHKETILENSRRNVPHIKRTIRDLKGMGLPKALIVSAGPSLYRNGILRRIREGDSDAS